VYDPDINMFAEGELKVVAGIWRVENVESFHTNSNEDIKVVALNVIYNFVVEKFLK
jgi:hypothetical protein